MGEQPSATHIDQWALIGHLWCARHSGRFYNEYNMISGFKALTTELPCQNKTLRQQFYKLLDHTRSKYIIPPQYCSMMYIWSVCSEQSISVLLTLAK